MPILFFFGGGGGGEITCGEEESKEGAIRRSLYINRHYGTESAGAIIPCHSGYEKYPTFYKVGYPDFQNRIQSCFTYITIETKDNT